MEKENWRKLENISIKRPFRNDAQINIMHTSNNKLLIIAITFINECKYKESMILCFNSVICRIFNT